MRVTVDGVDLPDGCRVTLETGQRPYISVQFPTLSMSAQIHDLIRQLADGNVHIFEFWTEDATPQLYAVAHAKLAARLVVQVGGGQDWLEVSGEAWGTPPNYSQFFVFGASGGSGESGEPGGTQGE